MLKGPVALQSLEPRRQGWGGMGGKPTTKTGMESHCGRADGDRDCLMTTGKNQEGQSWTHRRAHRLAAARALSAARGQFRKQSVASCIEVVVLNQLLTSPYSPAPGPQPPPAEQVTLPRLLATLCQPSPIPSSPTPPSMSLVLLSEEGISLHSPLTNPWQVSLSNPIILQVLAG